MLLLKQIHEREFIEATSEMFSSLTRRQQQQQSANFKSKTKMKASNLINRNHTRRKVLIQLDRHHNNHCRQQLHLLNCFVILYSSLFISTILLSLQSSPTVIIYSLAQESSILSSDVKPQQHQHNNILHFEVFEGAPNNTKVGTIRSSDGQLPYVVIPMPPTPESERMAALNINFSTGDITTNSVLDREHRDKYYFTAIVSQPFAEIRCTVTVKDINDNAPMFLLPNPNETNFVIDMPEGQRGIRKVLPLAVDLDTPPYGIKEFRIVSGTTPIGLFQLVEHEAPARSSSSMAQNSNQLDDATAALLGADNPQLMQQLAQQATVLIPSQPSSSSANSVSQSSSNSAMLQQQQSQHQIFGSNSGQQQSTVATNSLAMMAANSYQQQALLASAQPKYLIDLEVSQPLDRENQSSYQFEVEVVDGGQLTGLLTVTVNVQDVNDNDPVFPRKFYECHFREDTQKGTLIYRVQAYDVDLEANGQVSYYIKRYSSSSQTTTTLNQVTNSTSASDNNNNNNNNEAVSARYTSSSSSSNGNSRQQQQQQRPQGTASNKPISNGRQGLLDSQQLENSATTSGSAGGSNDASAAGYTKQRAGQPYPPDQLFDIDLNKGEIYLVNSLDFETDQVHEIVVEARDHGKPYRSGHTTIKVYVIDINDDPVPSAMNGRMIDDRSKQISSANLLVSSSDPSSSARFGGGEFGANGADVMSQPFNFSQVNLANLFSQMSSMVVFAIVLLAIFAVAFSVCLVKIKSRQPESDYNDTAGLTIGSNGNGQSKASPNHSASNLEHPGTLESIHHQHRHQHDSQRGQRANGASLAGLPFGSANGPIGGGGPVKLSHHRHHYMNDNLYHNPHSEQRMRHHSNNSHHQLLSDSLAEHQMASGQGSRGGTLTLPSHRHHQILPDHHPFDAHHHLSPHHSHHNHQLDHNHNTTSSLTYAHHHTRAPLLHQAAISHHQSSHHLASIHQANKSGTMNSIGTHTSAHHAPPSNSPNTSGHLQLATGSQPGNMHEHSHHHSQHHHNHPQSHHHNHQQAQQRHSHDSHHQTHSGPGGQLLPSLPPLMHQSGGLPSPPDHSNNSPTNAAYPWPATHDDCFSGPDDVMAMETPGSTMNSRSTSGGVSLSAGQPLDRWFDLGVSSQLVYAHDWCGSYNWDYLADWKPEYHQLMPQVLEKASGY